MSDLVKSLDASAYAETVASGEPVLVDFWAPWCAPCRALSPVLDSLADEYRGKVSFYKVDVEAFPDIIKELGIRSIPTLHLVNAGSVQNTLGGLLSRDKLKAALDAILAVPAPAA